MLTLLHKIEFFRNFIFCLLCTLLLTSCSLLGPAPYQNKNRYELSAQPAVLPSKKINQSIYLAPIKAYPALSTSAMQYRILCHEVNYFTKSTWIDTPANMLQPLFLTRLQEIFIHATNAQDGSATRNIHITLSEFEQVFDCTCSQFHITLQVEIIDAQTQKTLALKTFSVAEPAPCATPYGGVVAANHAMAVLLDQVSRFVTAHSDIELK